MRRTFVVMSALAVAIALLPATALSQDAPSSAVPAEREAADVLPPSLANAEGTVRVTAVLTDESVSEVAARGASRSARLSARAAVEAQQAGFTARASDAGAEVIATTQLALNSVSFAAPAEALAGLAADPDVAYLASVQDFEYDIDETADLIGADVLNDADVTGEGVRVSVLDSGVDFTHVALGGREGQGTSPGTAAAPPTVGGPGFTQEWGDDFLEVYGVEEGTTNPDWSAEENTEAPDYDLYNPGGVVVGGFDYVGEAWVPGQIEQPDPNPIDIEGHGTSVAATIHALAPDAEIYGISVCASFAPNCSGIAILQGIEFSLDPEGTGDVDDAVDIMNFSLGALYGKSTQNPAVDAVENATAMGVLSIASAGNSSDNPYISGTPSTAPSALGVAQTAVPRDSLDTLFIDGDAEGMPAVHQPWSPEPTLFDGVPLQYGDGADNILGCEPFEPGSLDGLAVIVDRGDCDFTLKASNADDAGAEVVIIAQNDGGPPFTGGVGEGEPDTTTFMVFLTDGLRLKEAAEAGGSLSYDPDDGIPLVGTITGSSSRGPSDTNQLKPEIGAPGANVVASAGTFDGTSTFGGTSGAAPVVSGAGALVLDALGDAKEAYDADTVPWQLKARLVNTAFRGMEYSPLEASLPGVAGSQGEAPITRIGGGEVRALAATEARSIAWELGAESTGSLSFGLDDVSETTSYTKTVEVVNYFPETITYDVNVEELWLGEVSANDAITVDAPATVEVDETATFDVTITIEPSALPEYYLNAGTAGDRGDILTLLEGGGWIVLDPTDGDDEIALPYHVLPRQAADLTVDSEVEAADGTATINVDNAGVGQANIDVFELLATSSASGPAPDFSELVDIDLAAVGLRVEPGGCGDFGDLYQFAVQTHEPFATVNATAGFEFGFDLSGDGQPDSFMFNDQGAALGLPENNLVFAGLADGPFFPAFFTSNGSNSTVTVLTHCAVDLGLDGLEGQEVDVTLNAFDVYFTGLPQDSVDFSITVGETGLAGDDVDVAGGDSGTVEVTVTGDVEGAMLVAVGGRPGTLPNGEPALWTSGAAGDEVFWVDVLVDEEEPPGDDDGDDDDGDPGDDDGEEEPELPAGTFRYAGAERIETAVRISEGTFAPGVDTAYIATAFEFADALTGGPAGGIEGGPVLLTNADLIPDIVLDELERLDADEIVLLGGTEAINSEVEAVVAERFGGDAVTRVSGPTRFDTALEISRATFPEPDEVDTVFVATGLEFADALSAGSAAALENAPVLLTATNALPAGVVEEIERLDPSQIVVLGGTAAVGPEVAAELDGLIESSVTRLGGPERMATNRLIVEFFFDAEETDAAYFATQQNFADALAGAPAATTEGAPMVLSLLEGLVPESADLVSDLSVRRAILLGGTAALDDAAEAQIDGLRAE